MRYLGWLLLLLVLAAGVVLYETRYLALQNRLAQQSRETEMWMRQTEQMKRELGLEQTRQQMAPDVSLLLADLFAGADSFSLTRTGRDTLAALVNELRRNKGQIVVSVFTDDSGVALATKARYPDPFSYAAAKGAAVIRYLGSQGIPRTRMVLIAHGTGSPRSGVTSAGLGELHPLSSRRLEIAVRTQVP